MLKHVLRKPNDKKRHFRWFPILLFCSIIAIALGLLFKTGMERCPIYVIIGVVSFGTTFVLFWTIGVIYGIFSIVYVRRHYYELWKNMYFNPSLKERRDAAIRLRSKNDPKLVKWGNFLNKFGLLAFLIWFIVFLLTGLVIWILKEMGVVIPLGF